MIFKRVSWRRRIQIWQDRRQPPVSSEQLSQRNVYILPSSKSVGYSIAIILLWLIGTNYENNLVLALSYLLMALYVSVIHATHRNLSGLCVEISDSSQVFAGESVDIQLKLTNSAKRARYRLRFRWDGTEGTTVDVSEQEQTTLELSLPTEKRGWLIPSRLHIETTYPLGILRAWSLPQLRAPMLVFPKPVAIEATSGDSATGAEGQASTPGIDEFGGLESGAIVEP